MVARGGPTAHRSVGPSEKLDFSRPQQSIEQRPTGCDDSFLTSLSVCVCTHRGKKRSGRVNAVITPRSPVAGSTRFGCLKVSIICSSVNSTFSRYVRIHWNSSTCFKVSALPIFRIVYQSTWWLCTSLLLNHIVVRSLIGHANPSRANARSVT